ncbi:MAG: type II toxin-antitoxin system Phd/YefM family antitoxin [Gemmatimonadota bacterium]
MRAIGIKQLKARLSEYVRIARTGETILITDRDEVVAELGPSRHSRPPVGSLEETLDRMAEEGLLTRAARSREGWVWQPRNLGLPTGVSEKILDDVREDHV